MWTQPTIFQVAMSRLVVERSFLRARGIKFINKNSSKSLSLFKKVGPGDGIWTHTWYTHWNLNPDRLPIPTHPVIYLERSLENSRRYSPPGRHYASLLIRPIALVELALNFLEPITFISSSVTVIEWISCCSVRDFSHFQQLEEFSNHPFEW